MEREREERQKEDRQEEEALLRAIAEARAQLAAKEEEAERLTADVQYNNYTIAKMRFRDVDQHSHGRLMMDKLQVHPQTDAELEIEADARRVRAIENRKHALAKAIAFAEKTHARIQQLVHELKTQEELKHESEARMKYALTWSVQADLQTQRLKFSKEGKKEKAQQEDIDTWCKKLRKNLHDQQHTAFNTEKEIKRIQEVLQALTVINERKTKQHLFKQDLKKGSNRDNPMSLQFGFVSPGRTRYGHHDEAVAGEEEEVQDVAAAVAVSTSQANTLAATPVTFALPTPSFTLPTATQALPKET
jgi:hypothetical protein